MPGDNTVLDPIKMTIPAKMPFLNIATEMARQYAALAGFPEENIFKILLSVEETVTNIISHSYVDQDQNAASSFDMAVSISEPYGICITINDKGMPFDPSNAPRYNPDRITADMQPNGLGLQIVRNMMDHVEYRNLGMKGKETILIKYCPKPVAVRQRAERSWAKAEEVSGEASCPLEFTVRGLRPEEAIEVSRCAYKSHGYTFFNDLIYYPEKIRELNEKGLMISAVAVTRRNEFMGHGALLFSEPGARIGEISFVFVDIKYRQHNCLNRIAKFLIEAAVEKKLAGQYSYAVTAHIASQKTAVKSGFHPLAILLATSPMTWEFKGIAGNLNQRVSVVLIYRYIHRPPARPIYPPAHHSQIIRQLYKTIGATHTLEETACTEPEPIEEESVIDTQTAEVENTAEIWIVRAGRDIAPVMRAALRKLCTGSIASVNLFISMEDETAQRHARTFEDMGFFFAGILPETPIGDVLVLQYLNNIDFDYESVKILPGDTQDLLNYIRALDLNPEK